MKHYKCAICGSVVLSSDVAPMKCMHDTPMHPCPGPMLEHSLTGGYVSRYSYGGSENPIHETPWGEAGNCTHTGATVGND